MKAVIQRVLQASVSIDSCIVEKINEGFLLLVAFESADHDNLKAMAEKILKLRIFGDENDKMNLSVSDIKGGILVVPQFTLLADCSKGNRPFFGNAAPPEIAENLFQKFVSELKKSELKVETGIFGAKMEVELINSGPVTLVISDE